ncbi:MULTISPECIES: hypothetical protein [unclassified Parafrankia]|uniref:hypothetical protein n=1 Tax=unclassified Parafrankia TaxID=2994368 RepID=UPI000DA574D9
MTQAQARTQTGALTAEAADTQAAEAQACGGKVETVEDVEALVSEPAGCAGAVNTYWHDQLGDAWTQPRSVAYKNGEMPDIACAEDVDDPQCSRTTPCTAPSTTASTS